MAEGDAGLRGGFLKCVEIDYDHVDGLDAVRGDGGFVLGIAADVEQTAMHAGMQRLDAAIEHLRKAGEFADVLDCEAGFAQRAGRAAGRNQLDAKARQRSGKIDQARLVGHAQKRAPNLLFCPHR